ncbi:kinase-like domain-containing protein [Nemania sp. FL0916]|nr:kinase-like domain-containing protein [Nemania sp. FL0916]
MASTRGSIQSLGRTAPPYPTPRLHDLQRRFVEAQKCSAWPDLIQQHYLPSPDLEELTSIEYVRGVVEEDQAIDPAGKGLCVERIYRESRVFFAIFVYWGMPISRFRDRRYIDAYLWLSGDELARLEDTRIIFELQTWCLPTTRRMFLVPTFSFQADHQELLPDAIMPFRSMTKIGEGHFSKVYRIDFEPRHLTRVSVCFESLSFRIWLAKIIYKGPTKPIALKLITPQTTGGRFQTADLASNEIWLLRELRGISHPHIIELLDSFQRGKEFGLFFPLASCNLETYTKRTPPSGDGEYASWLASQIFGLANALATIHGDEERSSSHNDLRPRNILFFPDENKPATLPGVLKIADFGQARSRVREMSGPTPSVILQQEVHAKANDMWWFGYIVLELLTWFQLGRIERRSLRILADQFYYAGQQEEFGWDHCTRGYVERLRRSANMCQVLKSILTVIDSTLLRRKREVRWNAARLSAYFNSITEQGSENRIFMKYLPYLKSI